MNDLLTLAAELALAQTKMDNAWHSVEKMEQADSWHDGFRLQFGRHAKAAQTRFRKAERLRDRLARRLDDLKARVA